MAYLQAQAASFDGRITPDELQGIRKALSGSGVSATSARRVVSGISRLRVFRGAVARGRPSR